MNIKKIHKALGFIMLLPFLTWAITVVFFFIKPGYSGAYEKLAIQQYPTRHQLNLPHANSWLEVRTFRSILGDHVLVKLDKQWLHLDTQSFEAAVEPTSANVELLITDAIKSNKKRYGDVISVDGLSAITSTDVNITLNWQKMSLHQKGNDTEFISTMYKIHYLQWTGIESIDKVMGIIGLVLVLTLALLGITLTVQRKTK